MADVQKIESAVRRVRNQASFIQDLLIDALGWEIDERAEDIEEISFEWSAEELRADGLEKHLVDGTIRQIRPFKSNPWGIFILEFKNPDVFATGRGMTVTLRNVLRGLVPSKRKRSSLASFQRENLLFICNHDYRHYRFAHFKSPGNDHQTAPLAAFGWGPGDPIRTLCEYNLNALAWPEAAPDAQAWVAAWSQAFDVEKVTKRFYSDYATVFEKVENLIAAQGELAGDDLRMFTQTLFNRLMFLRFIERKGWLEFEEETSYLRALYAAGGHGEKSFYSGRLRPLFFQGLAVEGKQESPAYGRVPYLNGGLFERSELDERVSDLPDEVFTGILSDEHAGGLFYRYNFTVEESTPLDIEVAVDPEMLGKVFEELVTGRHESGSYYTPRPVVSFMCREALKGYLSGKTKASPEAVASLVDRHQVGKLKETHAREILGALDDVKAVDPACGSGAYLLGLLQELITLYRLLYSEKLVKDARTLYDLKLRIISQSLYGVDIDPFATNIAKLRLWLSLAVEADQPVPLPNLDFKIETGDSLLAPDPQEMPDLFRGLLQMSADTLTMVKRQYFLAHGEEKESYRRTIEMEESRLRAQLEEQQGPGVVDWRIQFAEAFTPGRRGFDIVLANPPYVRMELFRTIKPILRRVYTDVHTERADLYVYFYARGLQLLRPTGMFVFISSNKWFRAGYGSKLRKYVADKCQVNSITDFGELPVFEAVATFPMIFVAKKSKERKKTTFTQVKTLNPPYPDVLAILESEGRVLPANAIQGSNWTLADTARASVLRKMEEKSVTLGKYVGEKIFWGVKTGYNAAFVIDREVRDELLAADRRNSEVIRQLVVGDDVRKWHIQQADRWLLYMYHGVDAQRYDAVIAHLLPHRERLEKRATKQKWYELQQPQMRYVSALEQPKVVFPDIAKEPRFALDTTSAFVGNTVYFIPVNDLYLLSILNSKVMWMYAKERLTVLGDADKGGRLRFFRQFVEQMPIPDAPTKERKRLTALARKCLDAQGVECLECEEEIDAIVATIYGVSM